MPSTLSANSFFRLVLAAEQRTVHLDPLHAAECVRLVAGTLDKHRNTQL